MWQSGIMNQIMSQAIKRSWDKRKSDGRVGVRCSMCRQRFVAETSPICSKCLKPKPLSPFTYPPGSIYIYALADSGNGQVRYVGRSSHPNERVGDLKKPHRNRPVHLWVRSLCRAGTPPIVRLLEVVRSGDNHNERERHWILYFKSNGCDLFNISIGGGGDPNYHHSPETIARFSRSLRGKPKTEEHKRKIAQSHLGLCASEETRRKMSLAHLKKPY